MSEREEFERWATKYLDLANFAKTYQGTYALGLVEAMWQAWQARAALASSRPVAG